MNYHAHIPAGIAFAAGACLMTGTPLSIPMLIAGAFGGALPDIDHPSGKSAISSMGSKAGRMVNDATGGHARWIVTLGKALDAIILQPLVHLWLAFAQGVLSPLYMRLYSTFGRRHGWSKDDPAQHRGGLTHSLMFMVFTSLIMFPISRFLLHDDLVWAGLELGILSHLVADSVCKSGIKWFWPWLPRIGFSDDTHEKGNGIRLIPVSWCMSTGKCPSKEDYLGLGRGTKRYNEMKKAYYKEKGWQWFFKALAITLVVCCLMGSIAWGKTVVPLTGKAQYAQASDRREDVADDTKNTSGSVADVDADTQPEQDGQKTIIGEHEGPTSLTSGDLDADTLPDGIIKLPDETLWVVGVGRVTAETLDSPSLMLTQDEKNRLLAAAMAQRLSSIPQGTKNAISDAKNTASDVSNTVGNVASDASNTVSETSNAVSDATSDFQGYQRRSTSDGNKVTSILQQLFGDSSSEGFGFLGLTPFTQKPTE